MSALKKLVSQTAIYGITHTLGRVLNFLLVPLYTSELVFAPEEYAVVNVLYSVVGFAIVLLTYGMETAFFNYSRNEDGKKVLSTGLSSILVTSVFFIFVGLTFSKNVAQFLEYPEQHGVINLLVFILALDALSALPFAYLRQQGKSIRFAIVRLTNIGINIGLNLTFFLLCPYLVAQGVDVPFYDPELNVAFVFIANLIASGIAFLMLMPEFRLISLGWDKALLRKMLKYGAPLIIVGLAGVINEMMDRILLKKLLPDNKADFDIGVYSAFYKLSIIITVFIQAFRYGAEPFFFERAKEKDPKPTYALVMKYFVIVVSLIMLGTNVFVEQISSLVITGDKFYLHPQALTIVPVLLLANVMLGINFNLNIWYKLEGKNRLGAYISIGGAIVTLIFNFMLIPVLGIMGSAITTLLAYGSMAVASYMMGQRHYPVPYNVRSIAFYLGFSVVLSIVHMIISPWMATWASVSLGLLMVILFAGLAWWVERPDKKL